MLKFLAKIVLKKIIASENSARKKQFVSWENINRVALLIDREDLRDKRSIDKFIEESKKHVEVFFIETKAKEASFHDWHCFSKKDRNFLALPNKRTFLELKNKNFDVCVNTCVAENLFSEAVHATLKAPLKCGTHPQNSISDLMIEKDESSGLNNYLNDVVRYLKMIRTQ